MTRRRLLNFLTALSMALCLGVVTLWVRSYWVRDEWARVGRHADFYVESSSGEVAWAEFYFGGVDRSFIEPPEFDVWRHTSSSPPLPLLGDWLRSAGPTPKEWVIVGGFVVGIGRSQSADRSGYPSRAVAVPYWALCLAFAAAPLRAAWRVAASRWARRRAGTRCRRCGYDLTGNVSGVCPECGVPAAGKAECNG